MTTLCGNPMSAMAVGCIAAPKAAPHAGTRGHLYPNGPQGVATPRAPAAELANPNAPAELQRRQHRTLLRGQRTTRLAHHPTIMTTPLPPSAFVPTRPVGANQARQGTGGDGWDATDEHHRSTTASIVDYR
jgi:hypothetical protein